MIAARSRRSAWFAALAVATLTGLETFTAAAPEARELRPGVHFLPGTIGGARQPDGNSVLLRGTAGMILVDTGRHADHTARALDVAAAAELPIVAIVNTHWHLDHIGGNPRVRDRFPEVRVWSSGALEGALHGFLADYRKQLEGLLGGDVDPALAGQLRGELAILDAAPRLAPDEVVRADGDVRLAGRSLQVRLARHAVTEADVWLYDPATRILVAGDLVTLPFPLFDTACPAGWRAALSALAAQPFELLVPGHGEPLSPADFARYRTAFDDVLACAATERPAAACVEGWYTAVGELAGNADPAYARNLATYYVTTVLRGDAAKLAARCGRADPS